MTTYNIILSRIVITIVGALWCMLAIAWLAWAIHPNKEATKWNAYHTTLIAIMTALTVAVYLITRGIL